MAGVHLSELAKQFSSMPTEEFLAMLLKIKGGAASIVGVGLGVEKGNEIDSKAIAPGPEVVVENIVEEVPGAHLKDKKRH